MDAERSCTWSDGLRMLGAFAVVLLMVTGCGGGAATSDEATAPAPTADATSGVTVVEDIVYHTDDTLEWLTPVLDVYAPADAEGLPVVVMFHGGSGNVTKMYLAALAEATADSGAVVFVPNHSTTGPLETDADAAAAKAEREVDGAACAVAFAVGHAAEYGGDPETLILFGHSWGGAVAFTAALRGPRDFPDCAVEPAPFEVDGLVAWDGAWLLSVDPTVSDTWGDELLKVQAATTPWDWLAGENKPNVALIVATGSLQSMRRPLPDARGDWLAPSDPDGQLAQRFRALGALEDDAVDVGDLSDLLADRMRELGYDVEQLLLPDSGHEYSSASDADVATVVEAILTVADR